MLTPGSLASVGTLISPSQGPKANIAHLQKQQQLVLGRDAASKEEVSVRERLPATCILSLAQEGSWARLASSLPRTTATDSSLCIPTWRCQLQSPAEGGTLVQAASNRRLGAGPVMDKKFLHLILGRSKSEQGEAPAEPQSWVGGRDRGACCLHQHMEPLQLLSRLAMFLRRPMAPTGSADEE